MQKKEAQKIAVQKPLSIIFLLALALPAWSAETQYELRVDGLACPFCAYGIEKKIKALSGVDKDSVEIRLNEGLVIFQADSDSTIDEGSLTRLINDAGFTLRGLETHGPTNETGD